MDISNIQSTDTHKHVLRHPATREPIRKGDGFPGNVMLTIASANHPEFRRKVQALNRELRDLSMTVEQGELIDATSAKTAAIAVLDWDGLVYNGKAFADDAAALLADPKLDWLVNQILSAQATQANFIKAFASV